MLQRKFALVENLLYIEIVTGISISPDDFDRFEEVFTNDSFSTVQRLTFTCMLVLLGARTCRILRRACL